VLIQAKSAQETPVPLNALPLGETMFEISIPDRRCLVIGEKAIFSTSKDHFLYEQRMIRAGTQLGARRSAYGADGVAVAV
jgi:hypothetical protein